MNSMWDSELIFEFIEHYRNEPILWDPNNFQSKNRSAVSEAWLRVQESMGMRFSVDELKKKKESLMATYRMHARKKKADDRYTTIWFAFAELHSFLGSKYFDNIDTTDTTLINISQDKYFDDDDEEDDEYNDTLITTNREVKKTQKNKERPKPLRKSQAVDDYKDHSNKLNMNESVLYLKRDSTAIESNDECDLYAQLLATKLRKLSEHERDVAMHEIDNIMFKAKMRRNTSATDHSSSATKIEQPDFICISDQNEAEYDQHYDHDIDPSGNT